MKERKERQRGIDDPPKLVPAGSVNRVLLLGGKNLTMFQSAFLAGIGLCVTAGTGSFLVRQLAFDPIDYLDSIYLLLFEGGLFVWGLVMFVNGVRGMSRGMRKQRARH
jgi:hypothetical protein